MDERYSVQGVYVGRCFAHAGCRPVVGGRVTELEVLKVEDSCRSGRRSTRENNPENDEVRGVNGKDGKEVKWERIQKGKSKAQATR